MPSDTAYTGPFTGIQLNAQPIEKKTKPHFADRLDVHSIFYTIQGEGPFCGKPAVFIRLAGCNLQCPFCDTDYTTGRTNMHLDEIVYEAEASPLQDGGLVVITGGEPFRQNIGRLIASLIDAGFAVQVETNGTLPPPALPTGGYWNNEVDVMNPKGAYIVCSPKAGKVNADTAARACCFKYVVSHDSQSPDDGLPISALGHTANPYLARPPRGRNGRWTKPVYIQPADVQSFTNNQKNINAALRAAKEFGYTLQLQIHKYLGVE